MHHSFLGDSFTVGLPTGTGQHATLDEAATELSRRLVSRVLRDAQGRRPAFGDDERLRSDPDFRGHLLHREGLHGDDGCGLGASHPTGWTALVARLVPSVGRQGAGRRGRSGGGTVAPAVRLPRPNVVTIMRPWSSV